MMKKIIYLLFFLPLLISCSSDSDNPEDSGIPYFDKNIVNYWDLMYPPEGEDYPYFYHAYSFIEGGTCIIDEVELFGYGTNDIVKSNIMKGTYQMILPNLLIIKTDQGKRIRLEIELLEEDHLHIIDEKGVRLHYGF